MSTDEGTRLRLRAWMRRAHLKQADFARLIHTDPTTVNKILLGVRRPSLDIAAKIEQHTGIPSAAWVPMHVDAELTSTGTDTDKSKTGK